AYKSFTYCAWGRKIPTVWSFSSHTSIRSLSPLSLARRAGSRVIFPMEAHLNKASEILPKDCCVVCSYVNDTRKAVSCHWLRFNGRQRPFFLPSLFPPFPFSEIPNDFIWSRHSCPQ